MAIESEHFPTEKYNEGLILKVVSVFEKNQKLICGKKLRSNAVLDEIRSDLQSIGFIVESDKESRNSLRRVIHADEQGKSLLRCSFDAYSEQHKCLLEIEAGRGWKSNAVHRNLVQAMTVNDVDHLVIAVRNSYTYNGKGNKQVESKDYLKMTSLAKALYAKEPRTLPFGLTVIGY